MSSSTESQLRELLSRWEEARDQGRAVSVEDLCREAPALAGELRRRIRALGEIDAVLNERPETLDLGPRTRPSAVPGRTRPAAMRVPGYQIVRELGRGGMGIVYLATQEGLQRPVALKMILGGGRARPSEIERFRNETLALARVQHPNLVQVYEVGEHDGLPFFSLEFVDGGNLDDAYRGVPQRPREAARMTETLARAMHAAHQAGVIHRDLKPANVLLTRDGVPKITDFGLAKQIDRAGNTVSGMIMGTPCYMAPEQAAGRLRDIAPATDVYALGAMLYEFLTGRPPFLAESEWLTIEQVINREPVPPSALVPGVPRDLETICLKCLSKEPAKRYATAAELADDLNRFLANEPIRARRVRPWERAWKWVRRRPAVAALLLALAAALVGGAGYVHQLDENLKAEQEQLARARAEAAGHLDQAEAAAAVGEWPVARQRLADADRKLADLADDPGRAGLAARADALRAALATYEKFEKARDAALYQATLSAGDPTPPKVKATLDAAKAALDVLGVKNGALPDLGPAFAAHREAIRASCYELLLVEAEALAQPLAGEGEEQRRAQGRAALAVLDEATRLLGKPTRAYHLRRARYLAQAGEAPGAAAEREKAAGLPPATALDHFLVGVEHYRNQEAAAAVRSFEDALRLRPGDFWANYFLAICYVREGRPDLAKACLRACLARNPDVVWVYLMLGYAEGQLREYAEAEADFQKALALAGDDADARYVLFNNRGVMRVGQKKFAEGVADLKEAIRLRPKQYQGYASLAEAYRQQGDPAAGRGGGAEGPPGAGKRSLPNSRLGPELPGRDSPRRGASWTRP